MIRASSAIWAHSRFILHHGEPDMDRYGLADLNDLRHHAITFNDQHTALATRGSGNPTTRLNAALGRLSGLHGYWFCQGKIDVPHIRPIPIDGTADRMPSSPSANLRHPGATTSGFRRPDAVGPQPEKSVMALESASMAPTVMMFLAVPGGSTVR